MENGNREVYLAALAGLLHDIGKFAQRAGMMSGSHPEAGGEFVRQRIPTAWRKHLYAVMGHHDRPLQGYETKLVALADRLSAGERAPSEEAQPQQLRSIFCSLELDGLRAPDERYWPLEPLELKEEVVFPVEEGAAEGAYERLWEAFDGEAERLRLAYEEGGQLPAYLESLLLLMQRYTWCIPGAYYRSLPDVSLYDHSRMTAALSACLVGIEETTADRLLETLRAWHAARQQDPSASPPLLEETKIALLVGGDISGVQDFIYTISSRGATSALRGRSFYLQLLTEAVVRFILRELGLPITNLIYQGGGGFYLLARPSDAEKLEEVRQKVSRVLLAHHRGDLYLALDGVPLAAADFYDGRITDKWGEVGERLQQAKQHRFAEVPEVLADLFEPQEHGGNEDLRCQVCGREDEGVVVEKEGEEGIRKCPPCRSYEKLGEDLRHARYLWLMEREPAIPEEPLKATPGRWKDVLAAFGVEAGITGLFDQAPRGDAPRVILALDDEAVENLQPDGRTAVGRRFLVNVTPIYEEADALWLQQQPSMVQEKLRRELPQEPAGKVKPFALLEAQSVGIKRLGVLRMDVDDLGRLFQEGFILDKGTSQEKKIGTLSRVAALSFAISLFFEGWVEVLARRIGRTGDGSQRLYSIYSGGDDLFFVGSWDAVVELACATRADLARFAAHHPRVHASAGIALIQGKYPLYQAANDTGAAERQAKTLHWRGDGGEVRRKDAVSFLGYALPWKRFGLEARGAEGIETTHELTYRLVHMVNEERVPLSLVHTLIRLHEVYEEVSRQRRSLGEDRTQAGEEQVYWGPWMWQGYYFLKRMGRRYEEDAPDAAAAIERLAESLHGDRFRAIEWIGLAARWAELWVR